MTDSPPSIEDADLHPVPVEIIVRPIRSRYRISVSGKGARLVVSPLLRSETGKILQKHDAWLRKHYFRLKESMAEFQTISGSAIPFRGGKCILKIVPGGNAARFDNENSILELQVSDLAPENVRRRLSLWYLAQSANFAKSLSTRLGAVRNCGVGRIVLKDMSTRWGTCCRRRKIITLNWRLILAPDEVYEYVFLHEIAHFKIPGHGRVFWDWMEKISPGARERRAWLNKNGHSLLHFLSEERLSPERIL